MKMKRVVQQGLAAVAFGLLLGAAHAQVYVGAEGGLTFFKDTSKDEADNYIYNFGADSAKVTLQTVGVPVRPFVGAQLTDNIGLELGYQILSQIETVKGSISGDDYKDTYDSSWRTIDYTALLRLSDASSRLNGLFLRVGGHSTTGDLKFKGAGSAYASGGAWAGSTTSQSVSESKSGVVLGIGYDLWLGSSKSNVLRFSYTLYGNMPYVYDDNGKDGASLSVLKFGYLYKF